MNGTNLLLRVHAFCRVYSDIKWLTKFSGADRKASGSFASR